MRCMFGSVRPRGRAEPRQVDWERVMSKRKALHNGGLVVMACVVVAAANCAAHGKIDPGPAKSAAKSSAPRTVLVFCDRTPGSFFWADTWQHVAERSGEQLTMTTTLDEFFAKLNSAQWSSVKILAKWAPGEPAFAARLMTYANANPRQHIMMFLCHDHGEQIDPNVAVLPSTVMVTWQARTTVIGYSGFTSDDPKNIETKALSGLALPDLAGIKSKPPTTIGPVTEEPDGRIVATIITPCESACAQTYWIKVEVCKADNAADAQVCDALYGPPEPGEPGDPEGYAQCMAEANTRYTNCMNAAKERYQNCKALCKKLTPAPPAEPVPNDGQGQVLPGQAGQQTRAR